MEKVYSVSQLKSTLFPLFRDYGVRKAVLFGSYGKGTATEKSDVDLFDVSHIQPDSLIDREIRQTGVTIYEKQMTK